MWLVFPLRLLRMRRIPRRAGVVEVPFALALLLLAAATALALALALASASFLAFSFSHAASNCATKLSKCWNNCVTSPYTNSSRTLNIVMDVYCCQTQRNHEPLSVDSHCSCRHRKRSKLRGTWLEPDSGQMVCFCEWSTGVAD